MRTFSYCPFIRLFITHIQFLPHKVEEIAIACMYVKYVKYLRGKSKEILVIYIHVLKCHMVK